MALKTGDILLFNEHPNGWVDSFIDKTIKCFTKSKYSHIGFVIVDPKWAPKGTYVWDSSEHHVPDPQDNKIKFGIALVPIKEYLSTKNNHINLYKRSPIDPETYKLFTPQFLDKLHTAVYGKHYDLTFGHWLAGFLRVLIPRSTKTFFCSAFVSYTLTQVGVLGKWTDWTIISPAELSQEHDEDLNWIHPYGPDILWTDTDKDFDR